MQHVFVLNPDRSAAMPCTPKRARKMLEAGRAAVFRRYPFTIILKQEPSDRVTQPLALKIDPGSQTTGLALVIHGQTGKQCIWGAELQHRGAQIHKAMDKRRAVRHARRSRDLRHRPARFLNRTRPAGWLAPSLLHRVLTVKCWASRLDRFTPLDSFSLELVSFDMQKMVNPSIQNAGYQRGTLYSSETRAYLMHKWDGKCAYCQKTGKLEVEHLEPRSKGGSNRISNLVMSCQSCNLAKGTLSLEAFLVKKPAQLKRIQAQQQLSLKDAAAVNATKAKLLETLTTFGYPVETGSGAQTRFNRHQQDYDKAHWIDAACVGDSGAQITIAPLRALKIKAVGRGSRQIWDMNEHGFPKKANPRQKVFHGFQTGDIGRAAVHTKLHQGTFTGRIGVKTRPSFPIDRKVYVHPRDIIRLHQADGYDYV